MVSWSESFALCIHNSPLRPGVIQRRLQEFTRYLKEYENTICGRHPIGVMMNMLQCHPDGKAMKVKFVQYEQSSACEHMHDSSVSYASAVVTPTR